MCLHARLPDCQGCNQKYGCVFFRGPPSKKNGEFLVVSLELTDGKKGILKKDTPMQACTGISRSRIEVVADLDGEDEAE